MITDVALAQQGKNGAEPGRVLVGTSTICTQDTWVRWRARDFTQVIVRFGTVARGFNNLFQNPLLRRSSNCKFLSPGLFRQGSPRSCVHGGVTARSSHSWISPIRLFVVNVRLHGLQAVWVLCPFSASGRCSRPASPCECPLQSVLVPMSTSFSSLSICPVALDGFTLLDWHLVVRLWLAPKCPPAVILPAQQLDQLPVARVPFHSHKNALSIVVGHQGAVDVFRHVAAVHVHFVVLSFRSCHSSLVPCSSSIVPTSSGVWARLAPDGFSNMA